MPKTNKEIILMKLRRKNGENPIFSESKLFVYFSRNVFMCIFQEMFLCVFVQKYISE